MTGRSSRRHSRAERYSRRDRYRGPDREDAGGAGGMPPEEERVRREDERSRRRHGPAQADPRRLYRDRRRGVIAGVCAGIADHFGFSLTGTRIATVIATPLLLPWVVGGYIVLALVLPPRPEEPLYRDQDEEAFWRSVRKSPIATLSQVRHKFRELEVKMQRLERYVTSKHFDLDRDFRDLQR